MKDNIMTFRKILSLAITFYFVSIIFSNSYADEKEKLSIVWEGQLVRDPFVSIVDVDKLKYQQAGATEEKIPIFPMELKGIMLKNGKAVAIINEEVVREGQIWHDFKIEHITKQGVTLSYKSESLKLELKDVDIEAKKPKVSSEK